MPADTPKRWPAWRRPSLAASPGHRRLRADSPASATRRRASASARSPANSSAASSSTSAGFHAGGASAGNWRAVRINRLRNSGWSKFRRRATVPSCPLCCACLSPAASRANVALVRHAPPVPCIERARERGHAVGHFAVLHAAREQERDRRDEGRKQKHDQRQRKQKRLNCRAAARLLIRRAAVGSRRRARRPRPGPKRAWW